MTNCSVCGDLSGWALVEYILFCHILWWTFYYFLLVITRQSQEWCCRVLTFFHGCLISYSAIKEIIFNKSPIDFQSIPLTEDKKSYLSYMLSYFLFDFCWIHFFGNETWIIYAHHLASILIIANIFLRNYGAPGVSYGIAGLELTNPYLQLRWFLRTHGYLNKPIHMVTELWFMLLFFVIRIIGGTVLLYYSLVHPTTDIATKISFLSIYGISWVLQWQIFMYIRKKYLVASNIRNINFINSKVSISPYFQRRTLDQRENNNNDAPRKVLDSTSPVVEAVTSVIMTESPRAESSKSVTSKAGSSAIASLKTRSPKTESSRATVEGNESEEGNDENKSWRGTLE